MLLFLWLWLGPQMQQAEGDWLLLNEEVEQLLLEDEQQGSKEKQQLDKQKNGQKSATEKGALEQPSVIAGEQQPKVAQEKEETAQIPLTDGAQAGGLQASGAKTSGVQTSDVQIEKNGKLPVAEASDQNDRRININEADEQQLTTLPGIGPSKAKAIIAYRDKHGSFQSVDELDKVKGIGSKMLAKLREHATASCIACKR
ncbi:ComEA family DNA-binding protein [Paenibacillus sp. 481]|uniref:ComEA family DNA-binding protein n=1 Tax=Paenibacillus sp. 481 TaxID=2835869 RepID=UPI001E3B8754|nr:ComEA family DNA-binding protein [Paenibacillus sp. 481]UHA74221.1 helix-hairpin-helix domain-containing protein [Paenibacillus sp. 481]